VLPACGFSTGAIFIIRVETTVNEYIIFTVKNAMNFPFGNQEAAEEWQDTPLLGRGDIVIMRRFRQ